MHSFEQLGRFAAGCSAHIEGEVVMLRIEKERRKHRHSFLPTDGAGLCLVDEPALQRLEMRLLAHDLPTHVKLPSEFTGVPRQRLGRGHALALKLDIGHARDQLVAERRKHLRGEWAAVGDAEGGRERLLERRPERAPLALGVGVRLTWLRGQQPLAPVVCLEPRVAHLLGIHPVGLPVARIAGTLRLAVRTTI